VCLPKVASCSPLIVARDRPLFQVRRSRLGEDEALALGWAMQANASTLQTFFLQLSPITAPIGAALSVATRLDALSLQTVTLDTAGGAAVGRLLRRETARLSRLQVTSAATDIDLHTDSPIQNDGRRREELADIDLLPHRAAAAAGAIARCRGRCPGVLTPLQTWLFAPV
jgi:hypothetical protein